ITGTNFDGATGVSFGMGSATFTVINSTTIVAVAPMNPMGGSVNVTVTNPVGTSAAASFSYTASRTATWVGGPTGSWGTAGNWSTGWVPAATDDVYIGTGVTVTHSSGTDSIHQLNVQGTLVISGGTLSVGANSSANNLTLSGGTLTGAGDL